MVVGVGGLGAPAAALLAAGGARAIRLIDDDRVDPSNLPRQPLFDTADVGREKVEAAAQRLRRFRPDLEMDLRPVRFDARRAEELLDGAEVVVDGTDSFSTKTLLNQVSQGMRLPLIHAGVLGLDGQLLTILPGCTACLACLFTESPPDDELPSCQQSGVLGPVVGAIGFAAGREALAILAGRAPSLAGRLAILDGARLRWRTIELRPNPRCTVCAAASHPCEPRD